MHFQNKLEYHSGAICGVDFFPSKYGTLSFMGHSGNGLIVYDYIKN